MNVDGSKRKRFFAMVLVFLTIASWPVPGAASAVTPDFSITIKSSQTATKIGEALPIEITLLNTSDHEIKVGQDLSKKGEFVYTVIVRDRSGSEQVTSDYHRVLRGEPAKKPMVVNGSIFQLTLQPGDTVKDSIDVKDLYDLSQPGEYAIQVRRLDSHSKVTVKSNIVTVTITP